MKVKQDGNGLTGTNRRWTTTKSEGGDYTPYDTNMQIYW